MKTLYLIFVFLTLIFYCPCASADPTKSILVLYKSSEGFNENNNPFRNSVHDQVSDIQFSIDYHDIDLWLPEDEIMKKYDAVISYYITSKMENPENYLNWMIHQVFNCRKIVILGNMGAYTEDGKKWLTESMLNRFFLLLGVEFKSQWTDKQDLLEIVKLDSQLVNKGVSISQLIVTNYYKINSIHPKNEPFVTVRRRDVDNSESHFIVKTPFGGMAMNDYFKGPVNGNPGDVINIIPFLQVCLSEPLEETDLPHGTILALLKQSEDNSIYESNIHRFAFKELLKLGFWTNYHYVENGLPDSLSMKSYNAVITWFNTPEMLNGEAYSPWLLEQIITGRKVIILGNFGAFKSYNNISGSDSDSIKVDWWVNWSKINNFFYPFGLEFLGEWFGDSTMLQVKYKDPVMVEKDIPLLKSDITHYYNWRSVNPENKIYLEVERNDLPNTESAFVVRTPYGGMAFENYLMKWYPEQKQLKFRLNINDFLKQCLGYNPVLSPQPIALLTHDEILNNALYKTSDSTETVLSKPMELPSEAKEVKRWVLIMYDNKEVKKNEQENFKLPEGIVLNHLGLLTEYWDVRKGLPDQEYMAKFRGIISLFNNPEMKQPHIYAEWVKQQIAAGRKMVIMGNYGAYIDEENDIRVLDFQSVFEAMGLHHWDSKISPSKKQKIVYKSEEIMDFEIPVNLDEMPPFDIKITSENPENKVYFSIEDPRLGRIDGVVVTPYGGIILNNLAFKGNETDKEEVENIRKYIQRESELTPKFRENYGYWRINPFLFFREAFDLNHIPIPDVTTLNGFRIFYSHIDGDGFTGISLIDKRSYSSAFVRDKIIKQYPLPFTVSVITEEIENKGLPYYNRGYNIARSLYELNNVEAATHSSTHPYNWQKGDLEVQSDTGEWSFGIKEINLDLEISTSIYFIEKNLLPENKKVEAFLWSGRCNPNSKALEYLYDLNIPNLNGGDPIFDSKFPSYSNLASLAIYNTGYWQYFTSSSNDYIYTKGWTRDFSDMKRLIEHFEYTESPIRILPLNIYFHFYIGDRQEGLNGLKQALDYCMNTRIAPLFVSEYAHIVEDFVTLSQYILPDSGYKIIHNGKLRTFRYDNCPEFPDLEKSKGIIGFMHYQNSLYLYLDDENEQTLYLKTEKPAQVYLKCGTHYIDNWCVTDDQVSFNTRGLGKAYFEIANLNPTLTYNIIIKQSVTNTTLLNETIQPDNNGSLILHSQFDTYQGEYSILVTKKY